MSAVSKKVKPPSTARRTIGSVRSLVEHPGPVGVVAVAHHPEAEPRDVQAGVPEPDLIH